MPFMFTSSIFKTIRLFTVISLFASCRSTGTKITGQYKSKKSYLNSKLFIKDDKSFNYINEGFLLSIKGENYYYTAGSWTTYQDTLYLDSYSDAIIKDTISIIDSKINSLKSSFTFFSSEGDTLSFFRVDKNNKNIAWIFHSSYMSDQFDVNQGDSLTFWFYSGYPPATIIISKNDNRNYNIYLQRKFLSSHFNNTKFLIKRNKLIELATKEKYLQLKNGM